jgi:hypothetical protein
MKGVIKSRNQLGFVFKTPDELNISSPLWPHHLNCNLTDNMGLGRPIDRAKATF